MPTPAAVVRDPDSGALRGKRGALVRYTAAGRPYYVSNKASRRRAQEARRAQAAADVVTLERVRREHAPRPAAAPPTRASVETVRPAVFTLARDGASFARPPLPFSASQVATPLLYVTLP
jgi:hypothetical protein